MRIDKLIEKVENKLLTLLNLKMKKIITIASVIALVSLLVLPSLTLATSHIPPASTEGSEPLPKKPAFEVIGNVLQWLWTILLIVAVIVILIAAYYFMTAAGNTEALGKARGLVLYAVVAIILAAIAWGIVGIAKKAAGG